MLLTLRDAAGQSITVEVDDVTARRQEGDWEPVRPQPEASECIDEPFDQRQYDTTLGRTEGSLTIPLAEVYVPKERAPGPHPYKWPAPRRRRMG